MSARSVLEQLIQGQESPESATDQSDLTALATRLTLIHEEGQDRSLSPVLTGEH
jgi:hypothetical protein